MKLTTENMINDIVVLRSRGKIVCGIEMGLIAWNAIETSLWDAWRKKQIEESKRGEHLGALYKGLMAEPGTHLFGVPLTVVTSLGASVNYLITPKIIEANPLWVSHEEIPYVFEEVADGDDQKKS